MATTDHHLSNFANFCNFVSILLLFICFSFICSPCNENAHSKYLSLRPLLFSRCIRNISKRFHEPNSTSKKQTILSVWKLMLGRVFILIFFFSPLVFLILLTLSVGGVNCLNPPRADGEIGKPTQLANWSLIPTVKK